MSENQKEIVKEIKGDCLKTQNRSEEGQQEEEQEEQRGVGFKKW